MSNKDVEKMAKEFIKSMEENEDDDNVRTGRKQMLMADMMGSIVGIPKELIIEKKLESIIINLEDMLPYDMDMETWIQMVLDTIHEKMLKIKTESTIKKKLEEESEETV